MRAKLARIKKTLGALLGGATAGTVLMVAAMAGYELEPQAAAGIAVLLVTLGAYLAPPNAPKPPQPPVGAKVERSRYVP